MGRGARPARAAAMAHALCYSAHYATDTVVLLPPCIRVGDRRRAGHRGPADHAAVPRPAALGDAPRLHGVPAERAAAGGLPRTREPGRAAAHPRLPPDVRGAGNLPRRDVRPAPRTSGCLLYTSDAADD